MKAFADRLDEEIKKLPSLSNKKEEKILFRCVDTINANEYKKHSIVYFKSPTSFSLDQTEAMKFSSTNKCMIRLTVKDSSSKNSPKNIEKYSGYNEKECITPANSKFIVTDNHIVNINTKDGVSLCKIIELSLCDTVIQY